MWKGDFAYANGNNAAKFGTYIRSHFNEFKKNEWMPDADEDETSREVVDFNGLLDTFSYQELAPQARDTHGYGGGGGGCFVAGTKISTKRGMVSIENVREGDLVTSIDDSTGEISYSKVVKTFIHDVDEYMFKIRTDDDEVECTGIHKFLVLSGEKKVWRPAEFLHPGTILVRADNTTRKIIDFHAVDKQVRVYNIEVAGNHNYCVGESKILVHNKDCFVAGTKVLVEGGYADIESIAVGDKVVSLGSDGLSKVCEVLDTMSLLVDDKVYSITIEGQETLECTRRHPFLVVGEDGESWKMASELKVGD